MRRQALILALALWCANAALAGEQTFGDITDIDAAKKTILVSSECECGSGKIIETNFTIGDETKFSLNKKDCKFTDLKLGDQVEVDSELKITSQKSSRRDRSNQCEQLFPLPAYRERERIPRKLARNCYETITLTIWYGV